MKDVIYAFMAVAVVGATPPPGGYSTTGPVLDNPHQEVVVREVSPKHGPNCGCTGCVQARTRADDSVYWRDVAEIRAAEAQERAKRLAAELEKARREKEHADRMRDTEWVMPPPQPAPGQNAAPQPQPLLGGWWK